MQIIRCVYNTNKTRIIHKSKTCPVVYVPRILKTKKIKLFEWQWNIFSVRSSFQTFFKFRKFHVLYWYFILYLGFPKMQRFLCLCWFCSGYETLFLCLLQVLWECIWWSLTFIHPITSIQICCNFPISSYSTRVIVTLSFHSFWSYAVVDYRAIFYSTKLLWNVNKHCPGLQMHWSVVISFT